MGGSTTVLALWAAFASLSISFPVLMPELGLLRRSESGPKIDGANFPDPGVIQVGDTWYAFATRTIGSTIHIQIAQSSDFNTWTMLTNSDGSQKDALPNLPSWVDGSSVKSFNTWGPSVKQLGDNSFVMYFSGSLASDPSKHCIGAATSSSITGPYESSSSDALICPLSEGGAIDPSGYDDNGQRYIVYKVDGNSIGHGGACQNDVAPYVPTPIMLQAVADDGVTLQGSPTQLLDNDGASDQGIIEGPSLVKSGSYYFLFFSPGCYTTGDYRTSYATSTSIDGTYTRASAPLLQSGGSYGLDAPGGVDIFRDGQHLVFHANSGNVRPLYQALVTINGNTASV